MRTSLSALLFCLVAAGSAAPQPPPPVPPSSSGRAFERAEPIHIVGPVYFVGTQDLGVYLVATKAGHVLIDGAMPGSAPLVETAIQKLGFKPEEIRVLLITQAHFD